MIQATVIHADLCEPSNLDTLPLFPNLDGRYLCVQASSTPAERTFSTAGDTISQERACLSPEKADMFIFLKNNC